MTERAWVITIVTEPYTDEEWAPGHYEVLNAPFEGPEAQAKAEAFCEAERERGDFVGEWAVVANKAARHAAALARVFTMMPPEL